jgi:hypothetical protein
MQSLVQGLPKDDEAIVSFLDKTWRPAHPVAHDTVVESINLSSGRKLI